MRRRVLALVVKEFLALLKDRRARAILIVPPVVQLFVFGYAATFEVKRAAVAVLDEDGGKAPRELAAHVAASPAFRLSEHLAHPAEMTAVINDRRALAVLHFPNDFSRRLVSGGGAPLQIIVDGRDSNTALVALGYLRSIVSSYNAKLAARAGGSAAMTAELVVRPWYNPNLDSQWFVVPAIAGLLTLVVTIIVTALSVAREREAGTFDQLLVSPLRPFEILLGKALPPLAIGFFEATLIIGAALLWFRIPFTGSAPVLYLGLFFFLLSTIGIGLMISALALTQQQALLGGFLFIGPAVILSGFATPIENMPWLLRQLTLLNPLRYFLIILRAEFLEGASLGLLWPQLWPMAAIGVVNLLLAAWLFRHRLQ